MSALSGACGSPDGGGIRAMIASKTSGTPFPSFALIGRASLASSCRISAIDCLVPSTIGARQIDLIDDRNDRQVIGHRQVHVGNRLGLYALCGIDEQERSFARRQTARHFIGEVDVTRRIDQMQGVGLPVLGLIPDRDRVSLDRDPALTLQVHRVENLVFRLSGRDCASSFQKPVSEG